MRINNLPKIDYYHFSLSNICFVCIKETSQGDVSFLAHPKHMVVHLLWTIYVFSVLCLLCLCARLFICALLSPAGKGLTSWLLFVVSYCDFVTFSLISWVRCGT